jgi:hypothetical protein
MFAKRAFAGPAATVPYSAGRPSLLERLKKPYVAAIGAALLFLAAGGVLLAVTLDPKAGAPSARASIKRPKVDAPKPVQLGSEAFTVDSLGMFQDLAVPGFDVPAEGAEPLAGQAVITVPDQDDPQLGAAPKRAPADPLPAAPFAGLTQPGPGGLLPVIGPDGKAPAQAYARPFKDNGKPKVALVVGGLGLNPAATKAAIERLPPEVTLSFVPYAEGLQGWIDLARANGHEVMLEIPMEPADYPDNDPGPYTLLSSGTPVETTRRLEWLLSRATGYFGVTNYLGQRFVQSDTGMSAFLTALKGRGVAFVDDGSARKRGGAFGRASADEVVDDQLSAAQIASALATLETSARARGSSLGAGFAYPVTVEVAARWAAGLPARGLQLAPASAVVRR